MSLVLAGAAAGVYAATVVGIHRYAVNRRRRRSGGFVALRSLDWHSLLEGFLPTSPGPRADAPERLPSGEWTPDVLARPAPPGAEAIHRLLRDVVLGTGQGALDERASEAGLTGGDTEWLRTLYVARSDPLAAIERLRRAPITTAPELYLREHLRLLHRVSSLNLEVVVFGAKRRLGYALARFGDAPCLFYARAYASALVGMNHAAIDDLARAVYFSHQAPFYLRAVLETPYIEEVRPVLTHNCRSSLEQQERARIAG